MGSEGHPLFTRPLEVSRHLAEITSQAGAVESQTLQGAGRQAATQPSGDDGQEAVPGKRRGQELCDALRH